MSVVSTIIGDVEKGISEAKTVGATVDAVKSGVPALLAEGADFTGRLEGTIADPALIVTNGPQMLADLKEILAGVESLFSKL